MTGADIITTVNNNLGDSLEKSDKKLDRCGDFIVFCKVRI